MKNGRVLGEWKGVEWMGVEWLDGSVLVDRVLWLVVVCSMVAIGVSDEPIAMVLLLKFANAVRGGVLVDFFFEHCSPRVRGYRSRVFLAVRNVHRSTRMGT